MAGVGGARLSPLSLHPSFHPPAAPAVAALPHLRALTVVGGGNVLWPGLGNLKLTSLRASGKQPGLESLPTTLRLLELSSLRWAGDAVASRLNSVGKLTGLTRLALDGDCGLGEQDVSVLAPLAPLRQLRELSLVSTEPIWTLAPLFNTPFLTALAFTADTASATCAHSELANKPLCAPHLDFSPLLRRMKLLCLCLIGSPEEPLPDVQALLPTCRVCVRHIDPLPAMPMFEPM